MSETVGPRNRRAVLIGAASVAVLLVGGYFAAWWLVGNSAEGDLVGGDPQRMLNALARTDNDTFCSDGNADLRGVSLRAVKETPIEDLLRRMNSRQLSEQDRDNLNANIYVLMNEDMDNKIDEYAQAPDENKEEVLDRHIEEMQFWARMKEHQQNQQGDAQHESQARDKRPTKQGRKSRLESTSPDRRARASRYWGKVKARMMARGITFGGKKGGK